jgi:methyl-accepting chemotaxis protein/methyl-accepting chemotaxis protein-1 (serine sensor receptor)
MKVSTKLYGAVSALLLGGVTLAGFSCLYLSDLSGQLDESNNKTSLRTENVNRLGTTAWKMIASLRGAYVYANWNDKAGVEKCIAVLGEARKAIDETAAQTRPLLVSEESRRLLAQMETAVKDFDEPAAKYVRLVREDKLDEVKTLAAPVSAFYGAVNAIGDGFRDQQAVESKQSSARAASTSSRSLFVAILLSCLLLVIGAMAVFVVRGIHRTLAAVIGELSEGAEQVASAASQISSSSQSLAQGSSEQAASIEQTSASSEEISSMARKNTENSRSAAGLVTDSQRQFVETNHSLEQTVTAMGEINTQSGRISKIIKVIDEIAFQTNILALNAAVEAARAGEAGMGFAVVADEVRNLAQRSAQAAKDTASLIEESIAKSNDGKVKVDQVATAIRTITEEAAQIKTLVDEVSLGSQEQTRGIEQIAKAITQMEQVTQKSAANAEQSASAAEELTAQSETLKDIVERLTDMMGSAGTSNGNARQTHRHAGTASGRTPHRAGESASSLSAPRKAVSHQAPSANHPALALAARGTNQEAFPLEEQFKEF